MTRFNARGTFAIYWTELMRAFRTFFQSIFAPVLTTSLYFVVFGAAIGGRMAQVGGVSYGAFIIPGLLLLTLLGETTSNASFGIYLPRFTGTIYELLSAPVGVAETLIGFVGAAVTKSLILTAIILVTASFFVDYHIVHPWLALLFVVLVASAFALFGFILGCWADGFELNRTMVEQGWATAFRKYSQDYVADEARAKAQRRGIWSSSFELPEEYRRAQAQRAAAPQTSAAPPARRAAPTLPSVKGCVIKGNRNRKGQWIYHVPGMPYYDQTRPEEIFCSEADAQKAGYRRAIVRP